MEPGLGEYASEEIRRRRGLKATQATRLLERALQEGVYEGIDTAGLRERYREAWKRASREGLALRPGQRFRGHVVRALLGMGGMGAVYKAYHLDRHKTFALKILRPRLAEDPEFRGRFWEEVQATVRLRNAYTVRVYEVSEDRVPYYTMEYVPGPSLDRLLDDLPGRRLPLGAALSIAWMVADSLREAHAAGLVHRDVKPGNILIEPSTRRGVFWKALPALAVDGKEWAEYRAALSDFGLVRAREGMRLTRSGDVMGTPAYMSPEQAAGRRAAVGPAADVYSLGMVLYEMLTGDVTPRAALAGGPDLPADVRGMLARALAPRPEERYGDGRAFRDAILAALKPLLPRG